MCISVCVRWSASTPFVLCQVTIECDDFCQIDSQQHLQTRAAAAAAGDDDKRQTNAGAAQSVNFCSLPPAPPPPHCYLPAASISVVPSYRVNSIGCVCVCVCRMCSTALRLLSLRLGQYKWHIKYTLSGTCDCSCKSSTN